MYAVEFETNVNNRMIEIPSQYGKVRNGSIVKVIIMVETDKSNNAKNKFNPIDFYNVIQVNKSEIDKYLCDSKNEWNDIL